MHHVDLIEKETLWLIAKHYFPESTFLTDAAVKAHVGRLSIVKIPTLDKPIMGDFVINESNQQVYKVDNVVEYYSTGRYNYTLKRVSDNELLEVTDDIVLIIIPPFIFSEEIAEDLVEDLIIKAQFASKLKLVNSKIVVHLGNLYVGDNEFAYELLNGLPL